MKDFMTVRPENPITQPQMLIMSLQMYSKLVDKCFDDCVTDFTSKTISSREEGCISRCWDKNMKAQERIQARFAENNEAMMTQGGIRN